MILVLMRPVSGQNHVPRLDSSALAKKSIGAVRISVPPKIDGKLNEPFWSEAPVAGDFVGYLPNNGAKALFPTTVRFAYDDAALYVAAVMYDPAPDSACRQLGRRDQIESLNTDYLSVDILPYNDGLNMYEFKISPANLQNDCKYSAVGQDISWDAVWQSATSVNEDSWIAEIRIPYSALRFPKVEEQVWGINMWRNNQRRMEYSTWCFVDVSSQEIFSYYGTLRGIREIKPPLRLSVTPYVAGYVEQSPGNKKWKGFARGGMDLRFGISESYTLDMVLIPDFGQVQSDDQILNLTPFEIRYDEKRQFFTEATEMFDKCDIFYSRRVGGIPRDYGLPYSSTDTNEIVNKNPDETRLINATKISGRNAHGLGLGFFNAMTLNTWAELLDTVAGETRRILTQPFTNYNVLVLDQNLKNNSYVTFINTNYYTPASDYCANVTGTEMKFLNRKSTFAFFGRMNVSQIYRCGDKASLGLAYEVTLSRPTGKFTWELSRSEMNKTYDINDMGYLAYNNEAVNYLSLGYNIYTPVWKIMQSQTRLFTLYSTLSSPSSFTLFETELSNSTTFRNYWSSYLEFTGAPFGYHDYYEPRTWGWMYKKPPYYEITGTGATDMRKKFRVQLSLEFYHVPQDENIGYAAVLAPRFRFSDKFNLALSLRYEKNLNNYGYVTTSYDSLQQPLICFGRRDITTFNNILSAQYIFNTKLSLTLRVRHYWSKAEYHDFYRLREDGELDPSDYTGDHDLNYNAFTADLQFTWYFAPGSEMSVVWKNAINTLDHDPVCNYFTNFGNMMEEPQANSISLRILYYLDYLAVKNVFKHKKKA